MAMSQLQPLWTPHRALAPTLNAMYDQRTLAQRLHMDIPLLLGLLLLSYMAFGVGATYRIAGKTGTAQVFGIAQNEEYDAEKVDKKLRDHALFIAFAPVDNPRIALAVLVENGGGGSKIAAPIARKVMDHYFQQVLDTADEQLILTAAELPAVTNP